MRRSFSVPCNGDGVNVANGSSGSADSSSDSGFSAGSPSTKAKAMSENVAAAT